MHKIFVSNVIVLVTAKNVAGPIKETVAECIIRWVSEWFLQRGNEFFIDYTYSAFYNNLFNNDTRQVEILSGITTVRRKRIHYIDRQNTKRKKEKFEAISNNLCELLSKTLNKKLKAKGKKYSTRQKSKDLKNYDNSNKSKVICEITFDTTSTGTCLSTHLASSLLIMSC